ncbi:Heavy metal-associated isoprenylated plant protein 47 [Rhynchospora pubera]|uniref:Heavy metal-associated isoprenylated plant protein 47 n=1 Tax=Rhynchospora pubera TaxID=906938 RepID=A0AAV8HDI4_9POAL|nr:Heavy metal-associated isoprenylated plant protein 47 [Rhynchospora pubera]
MVKQKVVIKLSMDDAQKRKKALQTAAGMDGIISTSIDGDKIVVEGDGLDSIALTTVLRKKLGHANLITVTPSDDKKEDKKEEKKEQPVVLPPYYAVVHPYPYQYGYYETSRYPDSCSIM